MIDDLPLALYVHMPWCVKKCPYCDFNSHGLRDAPAPYADYVDALIADLDGDLADFGRAAAERTIVSVFFGGGTPSLFPPVQIARFLQAARERLRFADDAEITLETNPGTVEHGRFEDYLAAGVNRLSFGVQSFDDARLRRLGRIHSAGEAEHAVALARAAGFDNFNIDLMYALPEQTLDGALRDVERALALEPTHLSHYQLTLEPNTAFAAHPPPLPDEDSAWDMQEACQARLAEAGFAQYEVSAYAAEGRRCEHNLNYWRFGDYLGIGAGAHGKFSGNGTVRRRWKQRLPKTYLGAQHQAERIGGDRLIPGDELGFEYMLNALRLIDGTPLDAFSARTGLPLARIRGTLDEAIERGWLDDSPTRLRTTALGQRFLNDVVALFMES
ncbi:radical SAM family heme chaperone HemW [Oleiagrimonas soli]|uniref:Heme chaperone HemW n=1 Tax=Oleiagrimonas soli TaxID=1543381 RepID=A0A099CS72_9GAMM|nr:radical SAM family heme chaperone HemW [Oleiagrimonas soli]KGI76858.1 coproporphyrinogen III oxidase [Oleiagrimonas soli]MBB6185286.1 oxygen-independent coproporphyrinogen-3 oxidase [Oleiagrimonas soli]